jgi:hypothetical protein
MSQGGGGGGGGGMSYSLSQAKVTPGRTYPIQVGSGALRGSANGGHITCLWGDVDSGTATVASFGGTSKFASFLAQGGGCAYDTGGTEQGSDGGVSANGRTGGRGGSPTSRTTRCTGTPYDTNSVLLNTTSFYTSAPCVYGGSYGAAQGISGVGDGTGDNVNAGLQAWEGSGGGGGAYYPTNADGTLNSNGVCVYGNPHWNFYKGCDGWDISGIGAFGGIGGDGIQSTWYQGNCNYYFGGGGGGGGSTSNGTSSSGYVGWTFGGSKWEYQWNSTSLQTEFHAVSSSTTLIIPNYAPLGGHGGLGGGGQAATGLRNRGVTATSTYQLAQDGVDGCGGGGGGGQAYKNGVDNYTGNATSLDRPGKGGNGIAVVQFQVSGQNYALAFNPSLAILSDYKIWPTLNAFALPIEVKQTSGNGYLCIDVVNPIDTSTSINTPNTFSSNNVSGNSNFIESGTALSLGLDTFKIQGGGNYSLVSSRNGWVNSGKMYLRFRYSGQDDIATSSCQNSTTDVAYGSNPLNQIMILENLSASFTHSNTLPLKNGLK